MEQAKTTVAVVGLGQMGRALARRLVSSGFSVRVWNRTPPSEGAVPKAVHCASVAQVAEGAQFVVTSLADDTAVGEVVLGAGGVLESMADGAIHVATSTVSPGLAGALAEAHATRGRGFVAAPVLGRPEAAEAGALWILAGGSPEAIAACRPLFAAIGRGHSEMGEPSHALLAKICANFLIAGVIELLGEASALAEKGGVKRDRLMAMLSETLLGSPATKTYARRIAAGNYREAGFRMPLGLKDVGLALAAGHDLRVPLPVANIVRDHLLEALARGREDWDWSTIAAVAREAAGLSVDGS